MLGAARRKGDSCGFKRQQDSGRVCDLREQSHLSKQSSFMSFSRVSTQAPDESAYLRLLLKGCKTTIQLQGLTARGCAKQRCSLKCQPRLTGWRG